jgi:hypothetical protein
VGLFPAHNCRLGSGAFWPPERPPNAVVYNLVTAFQRNCLDESWQNLTLQKLRYKLFLIPGELVRPQNRPVLRLRPSPMTKSLAETILARAARLKPLPF